MRTDKKRTNKAAEASHVKAIMSLISRKQWCCIIKNIHQAVGFHLDDLSERIVLAYKTRYDSLINYFSTFAETMQFFRLQTKQTNKQNENSNLKIVTTLYFLRCVCVCILYIVFWGKKIWKTDKDWKHSIFSDLIAIPKWWIWVLFDYDYNIYDGYTVIRYRVKNYSIHKCWVSHQLSVISIKMETNPVFSNNVTKGQHV